MPTRDEAFDEAINNALRNYSTKQIETAISKGLSELTGKGMETHVCSVDWNPEQNKINYKDATFTLRISENIKSSFLHPEGE